MFEDKFIAEYEEVVVSCNSFSYQDFLEIRNLNFMYYAVFSLNFQKWFFQYLRTLDMKLSDFFINFVNPDKSIEWPEEYLEFLSNLNNVIEGELHDTKESVIEKCHDIYKQNNDVGEPSRINVNIGARLIYHETTWIKSVLIKHLEQIMGSKLSKESKILSEHLIELGIRERIDLKNVGDKQPMDFSYDVISWKQGKFKTPLIELKMNNKKLNFGLDDMRISQIESFKKRFSESQDDDFYYAAMDFITPRSCLTHTLSYK